MSGTVTPVHRHKPRASDYIDEVTGEGKSLPLEVVLDLMWRLLAEAERLEASANPDDAIVARVVRYHASRVAEMAAPFCHPRMGVAIVDD